MEKRYCDECGAEISIHYITPKKVFRIDEEGEFVRDDNNIIGDSPVIEFKCSNDTEHDIGKQNKKQWMEDVEFLLEDSGLL